METIEIVNALSGIIEGLGTIGILVWALVEERKRATNATNKIVEDWDDMRRTRIQKAGE